MSTCREVGELIPWYVNGTLSTEEAQLVASHLVSCEACRDELAQIMRINLEVKRMFGEVESIAETAKAEVIERAKGKRLAKIDLGSFLLGFSFGANYHKGKLPVRGDLRLLGRRIPLISSKKEAGND